jgi:hypothetical protein
VCSRLAQNWQFSFYKELLSFLFSSASSNSHKISLKLSFPPVWGLAACMLVMTTKDAALTWDCMAGMTFSFCFNYVLNFLKWTFKDPSEQIVYAEWSPSESIHSSLSLLLFAGVLSSQFLIECVNFTLPAGRKRELSSPSHCEVLLKYPTVSKAKGSWADNSSQSYWHPPIGFSTLSVGLFSSCTADDLRLVQLQKVHLTKLWPLTTMIFLLKTKR